MYDVIPISEGKFLNNMKNSLNGLRFGFGIPKEQIKVVGALHGSANMLNYDDYVWNKDRIGEWLNVIDPATGKAAVRNIFYRSKNSPEKLPASIDPDDENSLYQDWSMQALQSRGVQFLSWSHGSRRAATTPIFLCSTGRYFPMKAPPCLR